MQKDDVVYVGHMLDTAEKALQKVASIGRAEFDADENLRLTLTYLIQTIGEAARHVSTDFQKAHPEIPWRPIIGIRHKFVHDYMQVDFDIVWDVVTADLPPLIAKLRSLVP